MNTNLPLAGYVLTSWRVEWLTIASVLLIATSLTTPKSAHWRWGRRLIGWFSARPWWCGFSIFFITLAANATLSLIHPPLPWVHDEFSYLLASDTFSSGRLTNPSHPHWEHFETFHVLSQPTYMSKYPPANGLVLSVGQRFFGSPIVGAWLSLAFASTACFWMLRAWVPPRWATIGGWLIATMASITLSWGQSYWGGAVAVLGGALVFGAVRRLWKTPKLRDSFALGCGLIILANSRPMEGFLASLPAIGLCVYWLIRDQRLRFASRIRVALPALVVGIAGAIFMLTYNETVTGNVWQLPYREHDSNYAASSLLIWKQPPPIPEYNHQRMRSFYVSWARDRQVGMSQPERYLASIGSRLSLLWDFFTIAAGLCFVGLFGLRRNRWAWFALGCLALVLVVELQLATSQLFPHYVAPVACLFWALSIMGLRALYLFVGKSLSRRIASGVAVGVVVVASLKSAPWLGNWSQPRMEYPRHIVEKRLHDSGFKKHLVLVSYDHDYSVHAEWVYNAADIDRSDIIWARDMGDEHNTELIQYYRDRKIWYWHLKSLDEFELQPDRATPLARSPLHEGAGRWSLTSHQGDLNAERIDRYHHGYEHD